MQGLGYMVQDKGLRNRLCVVQLVLSEAQAEHTAETKKFEEVPVRVKGLGFRVFDWDLECWIGIQSFGLGLGVVVWDLGIRNQGLEIRDYKLGIINQGL